ncbi:MAG: Arm DNA-binding domain-containing protein [gamma proteobacterium symbiont of Lucinoma myriamae]|nr:Arm DNA-binding domain-containing protein [gamma proteobacterium symbiont of Lucinoma myriamae]MCU7832830.1 Arm DNA-binding domain-containing protein [gamma proteobacterium symbiont of Lucinoma myriamae]
MSKSILPPKSGFTSTFINKLKQSDKPYELSDPGCKGPRLKVSKAGSKIFLTTLYIQEKRHIITLGHFPDTSLANARSLLLEKKAANKNGNLVTDRERKAQELAASVEREARLAAETITMGVVLEGFMDTVISTRRKSDTAVNRIRYNFFGEGKKHTGIVLSDLPIREVTQDHIKSHILSVKVRANSLANSLFALLKQFFKWATNNNYIDSSPIAYLTAKDLGIIIIAKGDRALDISNPVFNV